MQKRTLFWQLFPAFLALELVTLAAVAWYATHSFRTFHYGRTRTSLESVARMAALHVQARSPTLHPSDVNALCRTLAEPARCRLTVITPDGRVIADTDHDPARMDNHADRPEIRAAWQTGSGARTRLSGTLRETMMYVAIPLQAAGADIAVVRAARPLSDINRAVRHVTLRVALFGVLVAGLGALLAMLAARRVTGPLEQIRHGAEVFAAGRLEHRLPSSRVLEIDVLTSTLNRMSEELNNRIATITRQRDEENALLSCMMESVLAVDTEKRVLKLNASARTLLRVDAIAAGKTPIAEVIRNADLLAIVDRTLASDEPVEGDIFIPEREQHLQAHGTVLTDSAGRHAGAVLVLNDITRLRRLETMRRDFVANVSHELKTPITSIKGFAETLLDEAPADNPNVRRFLGIINKQADRLQSLVEDLLALSDIEHGAGRDSMEFTPGQVDHIVENVAASCRAAAADRGLTLETTCEPDLRAHMNIQFLEQAVTNLVDNAVKYSDANGTVQLSAQRRGEEIAIAVRDEGPGIARKHLPRLFERFYRVDKSRSRKLGGTGLGLAIVKRVVLAHHGRITVESELGQGSTFTIFLPAAPGAETA